MGKNRTLKYQLEYAVHQSKAFGQSKYDERHKAKGERKNHYKTYSYKTFKTRLDLAKNFGKWMQQHHPEIKQAVQITPEHAQEYLNEKASSGMRPATLESSTAEIRTLLRICSAAFKHFPEYDLRSSIRTPDPRPELTALRSARGIPDAVLEKIKETLKPCSNTYKAIAISRACGARAEGCTRLKGDDIREADGKILVHLKEKGGRDRDVIVERQEHIATLKSLKASSKGGYIIHRRGAPLKPESIEKGLNRAMEKAGVKADYIYQKMHSIRKTYAQETYNDYRHIHTKRDTVQYVNVQLGHGAERDEELLACYVEYIY